MGEQLSRRSTLRKNVLFAQNFEKKLGGRKNFEKNIVAPQTSIAATIHRTSISFTLCGSRKIRHYVCIPHYPLSTT